MRDARNKSKINDMYEDFNVYPRYDCYHRAY